MEESCRCPVQANIPEFASGVSDRERERERDEGIARRTLSGKNDFKFGIRVTSLQNTHKKKIRANTSKAILGSLLY